MNPEPNCRKKCCNILTVVGAAGTLLVMAWMVWLMRSYTQPPSLAQARGAERLKTRHEFEQLNAPLVDGYDWVDKPKGIIRIPVERAEELILKEWQDPASGHAILTNQAAKAFAPAPVVNNPMKGT